MTLEEYRQKEEKSRKFAYEYLQDDANCIYMIFGRKYSQNTYIGPPEIYKKFSDMLFNIKCNYEFAESCSDNENSFSKDMHWDVIKYILINDKLQKQIQCLISGDGNIVEHFYVYSEFLKNFYDSIEKIDFSEVELPYETGDIIRISNRKTGKSFYSVYGKGMQNGNEEHLLLIYKPGESYVTCLNHLSNEEHIEKVRNCTEKWIVHFSKKIKTESDYWNIVLNKMGVCPF